MQNIHLVLGAGTRIQDSPSQLSSLTPRTRKYVPSCALGTFLGSGLCGFESLQVKKEMEPQCPWANVPTRQWFLTLLDLENASPEVSLVF